MSAREVLHLAIPAYPVAVARVADPSLRRRPVAVAAGLSERALLHSLSAEAEAEGVLTGMSVRQARRLCPALQILPADARLLGRANRALSRLLTDYSPLVEPAADGRLFLDLTGSRRLLGPGRDVAMRLEKELEERLRLSGTLGVAGNKLVSRIAAGCLERPGVCDVLRGAEGRFIAPLPVTVLPGIGARREALLLQELNLRRVAELAALSLPQLRLVFGPFAPLAQQRARGEDASPVTPPQRTPEVVAEGFLHHAENDLPQLRAELCRLVEECGRQLRQRRLGAAALQLQIAYADGVRHDRALSLPAPQNHDLLLYAAAEQLFETLCTRRTRITALRLAARQLGWPQPQIDLFTRSGPSPRQQALQQTIDQLRRKYGMQVVRRGHTLVT